MDHHAIVSSTDAQGNIVEVNDLFCDISGYTREELLGKNHRLLKSDVHAPSFYLDIWQTISLGKVWQGEICNRRKDGGFYWVVATIVPFLDVNGRPEGYLSLRTDITSVKAKESKLAELQAKMASIFNAVNDSIIIHDEKGIINRCNPAGHQLLNGESQSPIGRTNHQLGASWTDSKGYPMEEKNHPVAQAILLKKPQHKVTLGLQWNHDGPMAWLQISVEPILEGSELVAIVACYTDITGHVLQQQELQARTARLEATLSAIPDLLFEIDEDGVYHSHSCRDQHLLAAPTEQLNGMTLWKALPEDAAKTTLLALQEARVQGVSFGHHIWLDVPQGHCCFELSVAKKQLLAGENQRYIVLSRDITERKQQESRLRESEQRLAFAVEGAGDGIWDWNIGTGSFLSSRLYMEMIGFKENELPPHIDSWSSRVHPEDMPRVQSILQQYLDGQVPSYVVELRLRCKDESYKWILCRATSVERDVEGRPLRMIGIHTDISQQKHTEENLLLFRKIFNSSTQCLAVSDGEGKVLFVNDAYSRVMGYSLQEMLQVDFRGYASKDGKGQEIMQSILENRRPWQGMTTRRRKDGSEFPAMNNYGFIEDERGNIQYIFVIFNDFSDELAKRDELSRAKEIAERASQAKSDFLSSMSHELRTPLNAIIGFSQILEFDDELNEDQKDNVNEILHAGQHLLGLINEVLDLAKIEAGRLELVMEAVPLSGLIEQLILMMGPQAQARNITMSAEIPHHLHLRADINRLKQVLLNLLSNAIKYNRVSGSVKIGTKKTEADQWKVFVEDEGSGIPPHRVDELFEPFNRLDAEHSGTEGTGIGLTICRRLIERMGGKIGVTSTPDQGSSFWIQLPGWEAHVEASSEDDQSDDHDHLSENQPATLLYIDDNPTNLRLVAQMLGQRPQWTLITADSGQDGIEYALSHIPDVILLDINMPGQDGYQVLKKLQNHPKTSSIPTIAITANAMPKDRQRGLEAGFSEYLSKPIDTRTLLSTLDHYTAATTSSVSGE